MTNQGAPPDVGLDRLLTDWLATEAAPRSPASLDAAFIDGVGRTRQRPAWATTERWIPMETRARLGVMPRAIIVLLTIAVLSAMAIGGYAVAASLTEPDETAALPGNGAIVYENNGRIWIADDMQSKAQNLTTATESAESLAFSHAGDRVAYLTGPTLTMPKSLVVRDLEGSEPLTLAESLADAGEVAWSPDDATILLTAVTEQYDRPACETDGAFCGRRIVSASATAAGHELIGDPELDAQAPVWAPDGSFIVFAGSPAGSGADYGLYRMAHDGSGVERVGELGGEGFSFWDIDVSPDGRQLVTQAGGEETVIYLVDLETGGATLLTDEWSRQFDASFSPDGSRLVFHRQESEMWDPKPVLVDLESMALRPLDLPAWLRTWSPDGTQLLGLLGPDGEVISIDVTGEVGDDAVTQRPGYTLGSSDVSWQPIQP